MILIFHHRAGYDIIYRDVIEYHVGAEEVTIVIGGDNIRAGIVQSLKDISSWEEINDIQS